MLKKHLACKNYKNYHNYETNLYVYKFDYEILKRKLKTKLSKFQEQLD